MQSQVGKHTDGWMRGGLGVEGAEPGVKRPRGKAGWSPRHQVEGRLLVLEAGQEFLPRAHSSLESLGS